MVRQYNKSDCQLGTGNFRLQTADCELLTADCELRTADCRLSTARKYSSLKKLPKLFFIVALFVTNLVWAQWEPDIRLTNDPANSWTSLYNARCIAASGESVHVVWYDDRDGNTEIYYKRSTDAGSTWGQDTRLTNNDANSELPSVAVSGSLVVVAWDDDRDGNDEIYCKRSADGGTSWEADTRLTKAVGSSLRPSVAISGSVVHIVWHDERDGFWTIYYKRSDDGGISWRPDTCLTFTSPFAVSPSIAASGSVVHIAWRDYRDYNNEIYYKCSTDGGLTWGDDVRLTNDPESQDRPSISASGSTVHIAWRDFRNGKFEIFYKRSTDGGINWEADTKLTNSPGNSQSPSITASGSDVHLVWYDDRDGNLEIYYKHSDDGGINWGEDTRLTNAPGDSQDPTIAVSGPVIHVVWTDLRNGNYDIYYKRNRNLTYQKNLYYACKVWGFVKYYHSRVSICEVNWDSVLVNTLPSIKSAVTNDDFNDALVSMLSAAGPMAIATTPSPDTLPPELKRNLNFGWINDTVFRSDVKTILDTIKNNFRPHPICWVKIGGSSWGYLGFPHDDPMIDSNTFINYPSEFTRLMVLFKYWNIINYFNPYNYVLDIPWDSTLYNHVLEMAEAADYYSFYKTIEKITTDLDDAHVENYTYSSVSTFPVPGYYSPKIMLRYTHGQYVVTKSGLPALSKGDVILSVDGLTPVQWEDTFRPYLSAGNPSIFRNWVSQCMLMGVYGTSIHIEYRDSLGNNQDLDGKRNFLFYGSWFTIYPIDTLQAVKWKKWNCNTGYVNMENLVSADVSTMYDSLKYTSAIIFDLRNYPNGTAENIANLMYTDWRCFAKLTKPEVFYPGTYSWEIDFLGWSGNPSPYNGKVIILCNYGTLSQAEFSCMILRAMPNSVVVGSQTGGSDGNITSFKISQDITTAFSSLGVYYCNGDSTERIGIVPDSVVHPTSSGIRQGRDEELEKALQVAGCLVPMLSVSPPNRDVTAVAGTTNFTVTSNANWSAKSDASWCTVTPSGSGNDTIFASYTENTDYQPRIVHIQVTVPGLSVQTVTVNQAKSTLGIEDQQENAFHVYPNPAQGSFKIVCTDGKKRPLAVIMRDLTGKMILEKQCSGAKDYDINISVIQPGCYLLIIKTNDKILIKKQMIY